MEGWTTEWVGARKRPLGEGGRGGRQVAKVGGALLKIPIDWLINLKENTSGKATGRYHSARVPLVRRRDDRKNRKKGGKRTIRISDSNLTFTGTEQRRITLYKNIK